MTTTELMEHLEQKQRRSQQLICDLHDLKIHDGQLRHHDLTLDMPLPALRSLCRHIHAPSEYIATLPAPLRSSLLEFHIQASAKTRQPVRVVYERSRLIGIARPDLVQLEPAEALDAVINGAGALANEIDVESYREREDGYRIDLVAKSLTHGVTSSDALKAGLRLTYSLEGQHALWLESFILRLVCSNGLTHRECHGEGISRTRRLPAADPAARHQQVDQTKRLAQRIWASLQRRLSLIGQLRDERLDVPEFLASWLRRAHLSSRRLLPSLLRAWEAEGHDATAYGAMNALTHSATHDRDLSARHRDVLARLAGILAFRHQHLCPRCFSVLRTDRHENN